MAFTEAQILTSIIGFIGLGVTLGVLITGFKYRGY
jgi:hypothetical protein